MKTYVVEAANGPFRETDVVKPEPGPGQVLVKVCASGVNPLDTKIRAGTAEHASSRFLLCSAWIWLAWSSRWARVSRRFSRVMKFSGWWAE